MSPPTEVRQARNPHQKRKNGIQTFLQLKKTEIQSSKSNQQNRSKEEFLASCKKRIQASSSNLSTTNFNFIDQIKLEASNFKLLNFKFKRKPSNIKL